LPLVERRRFLLLGERYHASGNANDGFKPVNVMTILAAANGLNGPWSVRRLECGAAPASLKPTCKAPSGGDRTTVSHLGKYLHTTEIREKAEVGLRRKRYGQYGRRDKGRRDEEKKIIIRSRREREAE
jgi:hypothetical protein